MEAEVKKVIGAVKMAVRIEQNEHRFYGRAVEERQFISDDAVEIAGIMDDDQTLDMLEDNLNDEIEHARWMKAQQGALGR